jgi:hypothetical protein
MPRPLSSSSFLVAHKSEMFLAAPPILFWTYVFLPFACEILLQFLLLALCLGSLLGNIAHTNQFRLIAFLLYGDLHE